MKIIFLFLFVCKLCYSQEYFNSISLSDKDVLFVSNDNTLQNVPDRSQKDLSFRERILKSYINLQELNKEQIRADEVFKNKVHYLINYQNSDSSKTSIKLYNRIDSLSKLKKRYYKLYSENLKYLKGDTLNNVIKSNKNAIADISAKLNIYTDSIESILSENQKYSKVELDLIQKIKIKNDRKRENYRVEIELTIEELKDSIYNSIVASNKDKNLKFIKSTVGSSEYFETYYRNPIDGNIFITSPFGERKHPKDLIKHFHNGVDIRAKNIPVYAILPGKVGRVEYDQKLGIYIEIIHLNGLKSIYGHLEKINVIEGQTITQSIPLGITGNTGNTTGPHLHFIVKKNNKAIDPSRILKL